MDFPFRLLHHLTCKPSRVPQAHFHPRFYLFLEKQVFVYKLLMIIFFLHLLFAYPHLVIRCVQEKQFPL